MRATARAGASALAAVALLACASKPPDRPGKVGRTERQWSDDSVSSWTQAGPRPLKTTLWYPAAAEAREMPHTSGPPGVPILRHGWSAHDARLAETTAPWPLIVLSHGTGGDAATLAWLAEALASRGAVVAGVTHHGNSVAAGDLTVQGFFLFWERAADLSAVIDHVLADPTFGPRVDAARIGAAGFSLGGNTVLLLGGARPELEPYYAMCSGPDAEPSSCEVPPESPFERADFTALIETSAAVRASIDGAGRSWRDERVRAVYAIAPAVVVALSPESLAEITVPTRLVVGTEDPMAPAALNADRVAAKSPRAELLHVPDTDHYAFLSRCAWAGALLIAEICSEPAQPSRSETHRRVGADAVAFFTRNVTTEPNVRDGD